MPVSCSLELPETVNQPHQPPAPTRSSGRKSWGVEIEEPGSTRPAEILDGRLYIASAVQASNWELLSNLKVTHIVNCSRSCNFDGTGSNPFSAEINYCSCGFADNASSDLTEALEQTWNFIETALSSHPRWVVLVHCASGISRSVALVCHYLMRKELWSFQDSIQFIRTRHPAAAPNANFVQQLKTVDAQLHQQRREEADGRGELVWQRERCDEGVCNLQTRARRHSEALDSGLAMPCAPASTRPVSMAGWGREFADFGFVGEEAEVDPV
jgi:hypothetical protein